MTPIKSDPPILIQVKEMRLALLGGISDMTLHRWLHDEGLNFPRPIYITRRRYWKIADVLAWLDAQGEAA